MLRTAAIVVALLGLSAADWELYRDGYGKQYTPDEEYYRMQVFQTNVGIISQHNLRHDLGLTSYRMGLNAFTDMTDDEYKSLRGLRYNSSSLLRAGRCFAHDQVPDGLPETVDWRTKGCVTRVKDQGQCGSCWAFSATGALEGQHFISTGNLVSLSEQNLVDCATEEGNHGCNGGFMDRAFEYIRKNGGIDTEESYPYKGRDGVCEFKPDSVGARVTGYVNVASTERALQKAVATVGPISVGIDASAKSFQLYKEGIYDEPACSSSRLDHGVLVVGYGTEDGKDYWLVKNSWHTLWGMKGYIKMSRNKQNQCGIATAPSYPTV